MKNRRLARQIEKRLNITDSTLGSALVPYNDGLLDRASTQWELGDWKSLHKIIDRESLQSHPDRKKIALLIAAAKLQMNLVPEAKLFVELAQEWGATRKDISRILISGVYNTLGRAAVIFENQPRALQKFEEAIKIVAPSNDTALLGHARSVQEMVDLGLLPQANQAISSLHRQNKESNYTNAHIRVLDIEVDLLRDRIFNLQKKIDLSKSTPEIVGSVEKPLTCVNASGDKYKGLHGLDKKLESYLNYDNGYFVELGANDGVSQSNTYYFEKQRQWKGLLIEPILHNFLKCKQNRSSNNTYACAACVSFEYPEPYLNLIYSNLMTIPMGVENDIADQRAHADWGKVYLPNNEEPVEIAAPAKTLSSLLDSANAPNHIDLLSLDVEGAEIEVLKGIDHQRYRFKYLLIECWSNNSVSDYLLKHGYKCIDKLSNHDFLFAEL